jgi:hypothetical protein
LHFPFPPLAGLFSSVVKRGLARDVLGPCLSHFHDATRQDRTGKRGLARDVLGPCLSHFHDATRQDRAGKRGLARDVLGPCLSHFPDVFPFPTPRVRTGEMGTGTLRRLREPVLISPVLTRTKRPCPSLAKALRADTGRCILRSLSLFLGTKSITGERKRSPPCRPIVSDAAWS